MPGMATAPGPGRSAAASTVWVKLGGMQKMLTSVPGCAGPPVVSAPAGMPVSTMVLETSLAVKAPAVRWPQLVEPVTLVQSESKAHGTGRHGAEPGHVAQGRPGAQPQLAPVAKPLHRRAKVLSVLFLQKPQKTFT